MLTLQRVVASLSFLVVAAPTLAQATRWQVPDHGAVCYAQRGSFSGVQPNGVQRGLLDSVSTACQPVLFADEFADGARRWGVEPWSLASIPVWLATDLTTFDQPGTVRHVWPRIADFGEVTFDGVAARPDAGGWQRIAGRLTRVPVRDRAGAGPREIELDR